MAQPKNFGFGEDERMLRDSARRFFEEQAGIESLRTLVAKDHEEAYESEVPPAPYDENVWNKIVELGWTALAVPEEAGGLAMNMAAVAALAEEAGRVALPSPLIATLLATVVLREASADRARPWLERIAGGTSATLAITPADGSWDPQATDVRATGEAGGTVLTGTAWFVQDARKSGLFVVSAASDAGVGLYVVPADAPGITIRPDRIVDLTRDQARVELADVEVSADAVVAPPGEGAAILARAWPAMLTIVSADMCGAAEWQLQTTAEYARVRKQFDHPLGFFQAVKHPIVNMMLAVDGARSLVYNAACAIDHEPERAEASARMAKAAASDTAAFCSGRSVQLHGGIGVTWECDVHIYFKRQLHNQHYLGDGVHQRSKLSELI